MMARLVLKLLISGDPLTSASQSARITGVSHRARLQFGFLIYFILFFSGLVVYLRQSLLHHPCWNVVVQSQLTATLASWAQVILSPWPPKVLR